MLEGSRSGRKRLEQSSGQDGDELTSQWIHSLTLPLAPDKCDPLPSPSSAPTDYNGSGCLIRSGLSREGIQAGEE